MKESNLRILIPLMTIAMLGLIVIQLYLIVTQYKLEEERFNRTVNDALLRVSASLEKEEAAKTLLKKMSEPPVENVVFVRSRIPKEKIKILKSDSAKNFAFYQMATEGKGSQVQIHIEYRDSAKSKNRGIQFFGYDSVINNIDKKDVKRIRVNTSGKSSLSSSKIIFNAPNDSSFYKKDILIQNVVSELVYVESNKKIEDRVSKSRIEKMLLKEFKNSGIKGNFNFGIKKKSDTKFAILSDGKDTLNLIKSSLQTNLFPSEMLGEKYSIAVVFPDKQKSILASLTGMLALLALFISVIIAVFYKTVQMFIKQKKITEIKNDLINNITHEFKTPISTISLACEALNEPSLSSAEGSVNRYSKIINDENERLRMMVDTLLNTAAMEKSEFKLRIEKVDFSEIVNDAIVKFDEVVKQKQGEIKVSNKIEDPFMDGDKFHLANFIGNLIDNAIKYNNLPPIILASLEDDADNIYFNITDNGIGIPKEHLRTIFDSFFRVQTGNIQDVRGNGIGLSYTKKIIEAHKGTIDVSSEIGNGTTFKVILRKHNYEQ